ncbi:hypothetical protein Tco_1544616, partial [Tanacetum coccineum]
MFRQTLGGAARNWSGDLDLKSVDRFEELSQKFLEEFLQQKRYAKDPIEIHSNKRRPSEGLKTFIDRFKSESLHIKGVPPVLRISSFMHGHGYPKLEKKLNEKIPKTVDEMFERVRAFIQGEVVAVKKKHGDVYPLLEKRHLHPLTKTSKEILAMESINFHPPPPLIGTLEKQNLNKFYDYHEDRGHNTNDFYQLKKQIEEVIASRKLAHLVKDIRRSNQRNVSQGRNGVKVINMINGGRKRKRLYKVERSGLTEELTFPAIPQNCLTDEPIKLEVMIEGHQKMQVFVDRFLRRSIPSLGFGKPSIDHGRGRKKQDCANGIRNSKVSFTIKCHNGKNRDEKSWSGGFDHPFYDQVPDGPR